MWEYTPARMSDTTRSSDTPTHTPEEAQSGRVSAAALATVDPSSTKHQLRRGAKALITSRGRVLLIQERRSDGSSFWSLPGGGAEHEESGQECLRREIAEEIRCQSSVGPAVDNCIYCHMSRPVTTVYTVFETTLEARPNPNPTEGIVDHAWRKPTNLPSTTLTPIANVISAALPRE